MIISAHISRIIYLRLTHANPPCNVFQVFESLNMLAQAEQIGLYLPPDSFHIFCWPAADPSFSCLVSFLELRLEFTVQMKSL